MLNVLCAFVVRLSGNHSEHREQNSVIFFANVAPLRLCVKSPLRLCVEALRVGASLSERDVDDLHSGRCFAATHQPHRQCRDRCIKRLPRRRALSADARKLRAQRPKAFISRPNRNRVVHNVSHLICGELLTQRRGEAETQIFTGFYIPIPDP